MGLCDPNTKDRLLRRVPPRNDVLGEKKHMHDLFNTLEKHDIFPRKKSKCTIQGQTPITKIPSQNGWGFFRG